MKMLSKKAHQCTYGCCRATAPSGRKHERRWIKRAERQEWKKEVAK